MTNSRDRDPDHGGAWPSLPFDAWGDACATLHMWTQVVGKVRMAHAPWVNHWWHVPLYVGARGLTTSPIPYGSRLFEIDFDFIDHRLIVRTSDGRSEAFALEAMTVADFYAEVMGRLRALDLETRIWTTPVEVPDPVPFEQDRAHGAYDRDHAGRFWRILAQASRLFAAFRGRFIGKASPVHFFWGSFDLAATRFSGRVAPVHPGAPNVADKVTREAYSHEVSSCGFWPGGRALPEPIFYAYAYPQPDGFADWPVEPAGAAYRRELGEFVLPYDAVRRAADPDAALTAFLQSTYEAAAVRGGWDRAALERA
ncbi:MAG TPA: DUF5996 family protein [Alphaproteobacteria bacterium]